MTLSPPGSQSAGVSPPWFGKMMRVFRVLANEMRRRFCGSGFDYVASVGYALIECGAICEGSNTDGYCSTGGMPQSNAAAFRWLFEDESQKTAGMPRSNAAAFPRKCFRLCRLCETVRYALVECSGIHGEEFSVLWWLLERCSTRVQSRRCREEGILRSLRYLVTVRRATGSPCSASFCTSSSSL
jgi:hypothetical protein